jgi:hypothetical protein
MKKFIENIMMISWLLLGLLTFLIICGEPPIGADPDLDKYHREVEMLLNAWVFFLCSGTVFSLLTYLVRKSKHF